MPMAGSPGARHIAVFCYHNNKGNNLFSPTGGMVHAFAREGVAASLRMQPFAGAQIARMRTSFRGTL